MKLADSWDVVQRLGHLALGTRFKRLGDHLQTGVSEALQEGGITVPPAQMPVLVALAERPTSTIGELVQALGISQPGVSRTLGAMERASLVEMTHSKGDRRVRQVKLTAVGKNALTQLQQGLFPRVAAAAEELCTGLKGDLIDQLTEVECRLKLETFASRIERVRI
jgi:DNA-binding MarR family transcriptional regulator